MICSGNNIFHSVHDFIYYHLQIAANLIRNVFNTSTAEEKPNKRNHIYFLGSRDVIKLAKYATDLCVTLQACVRHYLF